MEIKKRNKFVELMKGYGLYVVVGAIVFTFALTFSIIASLGQTTQTGTMNLQFDDEELDYVRELAWRINTVIFEDVDEDGNISYCGQLGDWMRMFIRRYNSDKIQCKVTQNAFESNDDIIEVLEAYGLDIEKFWYLLLFIYDITIQRTCDVTLCDDRSDHEKLLAVKEYIKVHPNYKIYLSDSARVPNKNRAECDDFFFFKVFEEALNVCLS